MSVLGQRAGYFTIPYHLTFYSVLTIGNDRMLVKNDPMLATILGDAHRAKTQYLFRFNLTRFASVIFAS